MRTPRTDFEVARYNGSLASEIFGHEEGVMTRPVFIVVLVVSTVSVGVGGPESRRLQRPIYIHDDCNATVYLRAILLDNFRIALISDLFKKSIS